MKIEVEKKMTHGEFAKYMVDKCGGIIGFSRELFGGEYFDAWIDLKKAKFDDLPRAMKIDEDTVTFRESEEITEDTKISTMIEVYFDKKRGVTCTDIHFNSTISEIMNARYLNCKTFAFHKLNDDDTLTLIWRNGALVEEE